MMMFGKGFLKSDVLSWRQKVYSDKEDVTIELVKECCVVAEQT